MERDVQLSSQASTVAGRPRSSQAGGQRAKHQKNRTGCIRCKSRHVRCDETKPECQRCTRINVQCPGYTLPKARIFGLATDECFASDFDKTCFHSFLAHGTASLADTRIPSQKFWLTYVPQLSQVVQAIRHATIAMAVLQEPLTRPDVKEALVNSVQDVRTIAIRHFNAAIRNFLQTNDSLSIESKLTCCLLFHNLTIYLERVTNGATHVNAADWYLKEYEKAIARGQALYDPAVALHFTPIVHGRIVDASTFVDGFQSRFDDCGNAYQMFQNLLPQSSLAPITIDTLNESLNVLMNYAIGHHFEEFGHSLLLEGLQSALTRFHDLAENLATSYQFQPTNVARHGTMEAQVAYLRIHYRAAFVFANTIRRNEYDYDRYLFYFRDIVTLCKDLVRQDNEESWSTGLGLIPPLFLVSIKCRDTRLRREAIDLLHDTQRVEGMWSSCMAAALARALVALEESANSQSSTTDTRVCLETVTFSALDRQMHYTYTTRGNLANDDAISGYSPYNPIVLSDGSAGLGAIPNRVLWAAGYSGPVYSTPRIACHCSDASDAHTR